MGICFILLVRNISSYHNTIAHKLDDDVFKGTHITQIRKILLFSRSPR